MRKLTKQIRPENPEDISVIIALYRPGPLHSGMAWDYAKYKENPRRIHPVIDEVLKETYGVIVYQEQIMNIYRKVAHYSFAKADKVRKIIAKKKVDDPMWETAKQDLIAGLKELGMTEQETHDFFHEIETFALYGFNKAHSISYARIAWEIAWFKAHYPHAFLTAMMQFDPEQKIFYMFEALRRGILIKEPHVNYSSASEFVYKDGAIFLPLNIINGVGDKAAQVIVKERGANGPYDSLLDFRNRLPKKQVTVKVVRALYAANAFDGMDMSGANDWEEEIKYKNGRTKIKKHYGIIGDDFIASLNGLSKFQKQRLFLQMVIPVQQIINFVNELNQLSMYDYIIKITEKKRSKGKLYILHGITGRTFFTEENRFVEGDIIELRKIGYGRYEPVKSIFDV